LPLLRRRAKRACKRGAFSLVVFVAFLAVLEAAVRCTGVVEKEGYGLGNDGTWRWFTFRTNSLGFRDSEVPTAKPAGEFRVLFLGDSFTFGQGVEEEKTFPRLLEKRWRDQPFVRGRSVRVINASKLGWNISEEEGFLLGQAMAWKPDLILLITIPNDSEFGATFDHFHERWVARSALWRSHLFRFLYVRWLWVSFEYLHPERNVVRHLRELWQPGTAELSAYRDALHRMADRSRREGAGFVQVLFPFFYRLDASYPLRVYHEQARRIARETGTPCLDLLPVYLGRKPFDLSVSATDSHPNDRAHALAAEAIDGFLRGGMAGAR